jgi:hypothetical protein
MGVALPFDFPHFAIPDGIPTKEKNTQWWWD